MLLPLRAGCFDRLAQAAVAHFGSLPPRGALHQRAQRVDADGLLSRKLAVQARPRDYVERPQVDVERVGVSLSRPRTQKT